MRWRGREHRTVMADALLELEHRIEAMLGQDLQLRLLGGEGFATRRWVASQSASCALRSSRMRKQRSRKNSWRISLNGRSTLSLSGMTAWVPQHLCPHFGEW
jgi:hypothetical protein